MKQLESESGGLVSIYLSVFLSRPASSRSPLGQINEEKWPYDRGDDPSFFARQQAAGPPTPLTWGICRGDVRNTIKNGDVVVFFANRKSSGREEYSLCAVMTVEKMVRHIEASSRKSTFEHYYNQLIRRKGPNHCWEHFEPPRNGPRGHDDWIWRMVERDRLSRKDLKKIEKSNRFDGNTRVKGRRLIDEIASNYVIFSNEHTRSFILKFPIPVANHSTNQPFEVWHHDDRSLTIREFTLGFAARNGSRRHSLRIGNNRHPHPHIAVRVSGPEAKTWRAEFIEWLTTEGCRNLVP